VGGVPNEQSGPGPASRLSSLPVEKAPTRIRWSRAAKVKRVEKRILLSIRYLSAKRTSECGLIPITLAGKDCNLYRNIQVHEVDS
jgi:hypothetical protein